MSDITIISGQTPVVAIHNPAWPYSVIESSNPVDDPDAGDTVTVVVPVFDGLLSIEGGVGPNGATLGIGSGDTIDFADNTGGGRQVVYVTGDLTGATSSGDYAFTTLENVAKGDHLVFDNVSREALAHTGSGAEVHVEAATSLAEALDLAAGAHLSAELGADRGVVDWFQYGGNTFLVEAINATSAAASHSSLSVGDEVVKIMGLVDLGDMHLSHHKLFL